MKDPKPWQWGLGPAGKPKRISIGEALIILGVILIVSILVFPIFATHRGHSKAPCLSNLKQLAFGLVIYSSDYNDRLPNRDRWVDATMEYTKSEHIYQCPYVLGPKDYGPKPGLYGYAFNSRLSEFKLSKPDATTPFVYDSINLGRNASDPFLSFGGQDRHGDGMAALAYTDTHVKRIAIK